MKKLKELHIEDLSVDQKLGMIMMGSWNHDPDSHLDYALEMIERHALGTMWVNPAGDGISKKRIDRIREVADYPIIICCDMESGFPGYEIGNYMALGINGDPEEVYRFGLSEGKLAGQDGYNTICGPILERANPEITKLMSIHRRLSDDKNKIAELASAYVRGLHDAGICSIAKHYPSVIVPTDSHMLPYRCPLTEAELLEDNLYPYRKLLEAGLLDGVMTGHNSLPMIDDVYPASLSKKVTDILRRQGFEGVFMTDSLDMMGVRGQFGRERFPLCINGGHDIALVWDGLTEECYESLKDAYKSGALSENRLNEAVARVLAFQKKIFESSPAEPLTEEDYAVSERINRNSLVTVTDPGLDPSVSRDGRHLFVIMTEQPENIFSGEDNSVVDWYHPRQMVPRIRELFPNSEIMSIPQFPDRMDTYNVMHRAVELDDVVMISYVNSDPYQGYDAFTSRILCLFEALQYTDSIAAFLYFGNPFVLENVPHMKRLIAGPQKSPDAVLYAIEAAAGLYSPKGKFPYQIALK